MPVFLPDNRRLIQALFARAAGLASFEGEEHPFASAGRAGELAALLTDDVTFQLRRPGRIQMLSTGKKNLIQKLAAAKTGLAQLAVVFRDFDIKVQRNEARVLVTVRAMGRDPGRSDYFLEEHRLECLLRKENGSWRIRNVINVKPWTGEEIEDGGGL